MQERVTLGEERVTLGEINSHPGLLFPIGENRNSDAPNRKEPLLTVRGKLTPQKKGTKKEARKLHSKPPNIEEFVAHGVSRGATDKDCRDIFQIWSDSDWHDGRGNKIESWKGKLTTFVKNHWMPSDRRRSNSNSATFTPKQKGFCNL